jgi:hypothetical protein
VTYRAPLSSEESYVNSSLARLRWLRSIEKLPYLSYEGFSPGKLVLRYSGPTKDAGG